MESIYESEHRMDPETIFKIGKDVGIDEHQVVSNTMLREIATTFNVDLDGYYERVYLNGEPESISDSRTELPISLSRVGEYNYYPENSYSTNNSSYPSRSAPQNESTAQPMLDLKALGFLDLLF